MISRDAARNVVGIIGKFRAFCSARFWFGSVQFSSRYDGSAAAAAAFVCSILRGRG
jgi:hypothetical protein